jgi:large subunit ribosomal protein L4e
MAGKIKTANVYSLKGEVVKTLALPSVFQTSYRPDVIKKAVVASEANKRQPYGPSKMAGMRHSVKTWGKGRGVARVQRLAQGRHAAESPNNVTGRRAHPPKPEKDWSQKVNKKERILAKRSALAAVADEDMVRGRGHKFDDAVSLPLVVEDGFEGITSTKDVVELLDALGLGYDLDRAKDGKRIRAGRGTMRDRKYKVPRSVLLVVGDDDVPLFKGASNLTGVEVVSARGLNASLLAPGGDAGRLTVFSESALRRVGEW